MQRILLPVALALSTAAVAQGTLLPLPAFSSTFSANATRGFFFQAPINFVITGLRVPDETMNGTQNVEVFKLAAPPPIYSATGTGGQVFYAANQPAATILQTNILVNAGEYVAILGACGTTTMANSYGSGLFASNVLGSPIVLERFLTQFNINTTGGNQPYSQEVGGSIARVEVYATPAAGFAQANAYGDGCGGVEQFASYYELFSAGTFDLGGAPGAETVLQHLNAGSGFVVLPGAPAWYTPVAPDLGLADDQVSAALPLGFSMAFPGAGPTITDIYVSSNGFIWLANNTNSDLSASVSELVTQDPRIAMFWQDLRPGSGSGGGTIHFDTDPANGVAYVTFVGVEEYNNAAAVISMQCALYSNGSFELRYGTETMSSAGIRTPLVGYSPGNGAFTPPQSDLSVLPIFTQPDQLVPALTLSSTRPVEGTTMSININDIPVGTALGTVVVSPAQVFPGVQPIPGLGGCFQYVGLDNVTYFVPTGANHMLSLPIPASGYNGAQVFAQAITLSPGINAVGVASSNGLEWIIDMQ